MYTLSVEYIEFLAARIDEREVEDKAISAVVRGTVSPCSVTHELLALTVTRELTVKQCQYVMSYYVDKRSMKDIASDFDVNIATVSRTLKRARKRLRRCLRYGGLELLKNSLE